jgi:hypothetical protein
MHVDFAHEYITSLFLVGSIEISTLVEILSLCNGISCLVLLVSTISSATAVSSLLQALDTLPLKSLQLSMDVDVSTSFSTSNVFKHLTHFDTHDHRMLEKLHAGLDCLDSLTHLCVVLRLEKCDPLAVIHLIGNLRIQILAFRVEDPHHAVERFLEDHRLLDRRIVLLPIQLTNWAMLGQGEMLMWQLAEDLVKLPMPQKSKTFIQSTRIETV